MHPSEVLFQGKRQPLLLPACDHYCGSEKLMRKSMALQQELGPVFDITFDCEDGAAAGNEAAHAQLVADLINSEDNRHKRIGARLHDIDSPFFESDVTTIVGGAANNLAYVVLPKPNGVADVRRALEIINRVAIPAGRPNAAPAALPVHVLVETHGALREAYDIAALPQVECLSFGIMDFVSSHYGAIPASAMRTPGQFSHPLVVRAKLEMVAACHAHGKVASHNVTTEIKDSAVVANDAQRAGAIRVHAHVEHPPGPDQADHQGVHAKAVGGERSHQHPAGSDGGTLGTDRSAWALARPRQLPILLDRFAAREAGRPGAA